MSVREEQGDRIDLFDVFFAIWNHKWLVVGVALSSTIFGVAYALLATPIYRVEVVLAAAQAEDEAPLNGELRGLASLAGIEMGRSFSSTDALATFRSRIFVEEFIESRRLLPVLFKDQWDSEEQQWTVEADVQPDIRDGVRFFIESVRSITRDEATGLVTLGIEWADPAIAADWAAALVERINERMRARDLTESRIRLRYLNQQLESAQLVELRQAIARLIENEIQTVMLAEGRREYAFRVIDPPRVPKERIRPQRATIVLLAAALGLVSGVLVALLALSLSRAGHRRVSSG